MAVEPTKFAKIINEGSSALYTAVLKDENGTAIGSASIGVLTLTLVNVDDEAILNSRDEQDVLNLNDVTVDANGNLAWTLQPEDTAIQNDANPYELHRATFQCTFNSGTGQANWDVDFHIRNLVTIPRPVGSPP